MTPHWVANRLRKHQNAHPCIGNTEVRPRILCAVGRVGGRQSVAKTPKTSFFPRENGGKAEETLGRSTSMGPSKPRLVLKKHE